MTQFSPNFDSEHLVPASIDPLGQYPRWRRRLSRSRSMSFSAYEICLHIVVKPRIRMMYLGLLISYCSIMIPHNAASRTPLRYLADRIPDLPPSVKKQKYSQLERCLTHSEIHRNITWRKRIANCMQLQKFGLGLTRTDR